MPRQPNRRDFLQHSAAISTAATVGVWSSRSLAESKSPNEKLNIGCIGVGGKGTVDSAGVASENIVAICDVDEGRLGKSAGRYTKAKRYFDFRKLLEQKNIDAVTVSTPDHTHAPASVMAMRLGKHVYCQKPLAHSIHEIRVMQQVAREHKVATQMGNQGHSETGSRQMVEWIRSGVIGDVKEAHVWTDRPIWPQGIKRPPATATPSSLKWDLWLGPASQRAYHAGLHPFAWRGYWDFGTGALGDMACHNMDMAFWALQLDQPSKVSAKSSGINPDTAPKWSIIEYEFPANEKRPAIKLTWYDGKKKPPAQLVPGASSLPANGTILVGSKGTLYVPHYWGVGRLLPAEKFADFKPPEPSIPRSPGHYIEWIRACKGGPAALSNFDYAVPLTEMVLLGNLALRTGETIRWDAKNAKAIDNPRANELVKPEYRKGWTL